MDKKYIFFDIDGTLTTGGFGAVIPDSAKDTIQKLRTNGHEVFIATGRPYAMTYEVAEELGIDSYICNGGNTVIYHKEKIMNESLNQEHVQTLIKECLRFQFPFCISQADDFYFLTKDLNSLPAHNDQFIMDFIQEADFDPYHLERVKRLMIFVTRKQIQKLTQFSDLVPQRYDDAFVMIEPDDKFKGIKHLMGVLKAPIEDVVVFGDGENDIKMFQQAPLAIAVGNAVSELKEEADYVTARSDEDGIQKACQHFGFI